MKFHKIKITNFRSFKEEQVFNFPEDPGLYFMTGLNLDEPRLGSNGAGKSTVWDALYWCLYGKTPTGLKAGDINNWGAGKGTRVELVLEDDRGIEYTIKRTWGPISWKIRSRDMTGEFGDFDDESDLDPKDPNNQALSLIHMEASPFLQSILMAQEESMFLDMKSEAQAELFSDVMGLDRWIGYSTKASKKAAAQDTISRQLERDLSLVAGKIDSRNYKDFAQYSVTWEKDRELKLAKIESEYMPALKRSKEIAAKILAAGEDEVNKRALYQVSKNTVELPRENLKSEERELSDRREVLNSALKDLKHAKDLEVGLNDSSACPTCGQHMRREEALAVRRKSALRVERFTTIVQKTEKEVAACASRVERFARAAGALEEAERLALQDLDDATNYYKNLCRDKQFLERDLDELEVRAEQASAEVNPYTDLEAKAHADSKKLLEDRDEIQRDLDLSNYRYSVLSYWVKGFKEIRLQQIAEALNELEIEVNSCCAALGLDDWELNFQVDRETKGGGVSRGFSVLVKSPNNRQAVPWHSWSGGEKQRLRLAGNTGLADLIRSRTASAIPLEVWDEPTQGLNEGGVTDLLESLAARARHEKLQIWIVDHRTHNFGGFSGSALITKTGKGSAISQS